MKVIVRYKSKSHPSTWHQVRQGGDGVLYCTCPGWRFSNVKKRQCKHTLRAIAEGKVQVRVRRVVISQTVVA